MSDFGPHGGADEEYAAVRRYSADVVSSIHQLASTPDVEARDANGNCE